MRVLVLTDGLDARGLERQLTLLVSNLPTAWQAHVVSLRDGPFAEVIRNAGVDVTVQSRSFRLDPGPGVGLWGVIRRWRPDVVHSWDWMHTLVAAPLCRALRVPLIDASIRTGMLPPRRPRVSWLAPRLANAVVANSRAGLHAWGLRSAATTDSGSGSFEGKGRVIYNAFDPSRLSLCHQVSRIPMPFTVVMTGGMVAHKDYRTYLRTARSLLAGEPGAWRFRLVGSGPERGALEAEARDLVQEGGVEFHSPGVEVLPLVGECDAGVLLTDPTLAQEGCSNSLMEYMACGLPAICSEGGGNRELVVDGVTGFIIPPGDWQALAQRLTLLRDDRERRTGMGAAGRVRIEREFSLARMVGSTVALYEQLTCHRKAARS